MGIPSPLSFPPTALRNVAAGLVVGNPIGSGGTRGKALTAAELKAIVEASGISYLPLSGGTMTGALSLGSNALTAGALKLGDTSASGMIKQGTSTEAGNVPGIVVRDATDAGYMALHSRRLTSSEGLIGCWDGSSTWNGWVIYRNQFVGTSDSRISWSNTSSSLGGTEDLILKRANAGVLAQRNGINAQCFLLNKSYTSDSSQEALMLDAGKQISGKLGLYSYRGSSSGSNYPIQIGMLASNGTTFTGVAVATDGAIIAGAEPFFDGAIQLNFGGYGMVGFRNYAGGSSYPAAAGGGTGGGPLSGFQVASNASYNFSATTSAATGNTDATISRNAAGIVQIGTTAKNALGSLLLTNLTASGVSKIILPTSDPHILGCLWNNSGTITISAG